MSKYDSSLTVFSPDGHLLQVDNARRAVDRGTPALAVRTDDCIVIALERKQSARLQDPRTIRKLYDIGDNLTIAYAGLTADARVLMDRARLEYQNWCLTYSQPPTVGRMAKTLGHILQEHTQSGGTRPFGVSLLLAGFDPRGEKKARIYVCEPNGVYNEWVGTAIGNKAKDLIEVLEKKYAEIPALKPEEIDAGKVKVFRDEEQLIDVAKTALSEVVDITPSNTEFRVLRRK